MKKAIPYYRVSTERQGHSGLGLEVQRQAVIGFAASNNYELVHEFIEVETGKKNNRPILLQALEQCKDEEATLLIAKLDRLGRNVAFISKLMESKVDFKAVDNPYAGKLIVHIMAAFAEHERDIISERTSAALQAAKKRGVELGYNGKYVLSKQNIISADEFANKMKPILELIKQNGIKTIRAITDELNKLNIPTYRNKGIWYVSSEVYSRTTGKWSLQRSSCVPFLISFCIWSWVINSIWFPFIQLIAVVCCYVLELVFRYVPKLTQ